MKIPKLPGYRVIGNLMFLILFILAAVFYLERSVFLDPGYLVFNILYYNDFVTGSGRIAVVFPQAPAVAAMHLNLPLKSILFIFSISFILLYYIVYLIISYLFRLDKIAVAVPLLLVTGIKYSFFWISTETHQALVYSILLFAFLKWTKNLEPGPKRLFIKLVPGILIILLGFLSHPIAFFTNMFILVYAIIDQNSWKRIDLYILSASTLGLAVIKYFTSGNAGYEGIFFSGFGEFFERITRLSESGSLQFLNYKLFNIYLVSLIITIATTTWYIIRKEFLKLVFYLASVTLFLLIIFTTFNQPFIHFIHEKNIMGVHVFLLIPFLNDLSFRKEKANEWMKVFIFLMFLAGVTQVVMGSAFHRDRIAYIRKLISVARQFPEKKFILDESLVEPDLLRVNWGLAVESMLLSSLESRDSSVSIYLDDAAGKVSKDLNFSDTTLFICTPWYQNLSTTQLNPRYFNLRHSGYRFLTTMDFTTGPETFLVDENYEKLAVSPDGHGIIDSAGNRCLRTKDEFSNFFMGDYEKNIPKSAAYISASVKIRPHSPVQPGSVGLVITQQINQKIYSYFSSMYQKNDSLIPGRFNSMKVAAIFYPKDQGTQLHCYLWNPGKLLLDIDDVKLSWHGMR